MQNEEQLTARIQEEAEALLDLCARGLEISKVIQHTLAADAVLQKQRSRTSLDGAVAQLRQDCKTSLARELANLRSTEVPSQSEWTSPSFQIFSDTSNGGLGAEALRFGSLAFDVIGKRVRIPLTLDVLGRCNLILSWGANGRTQVVSIFQSILLRSLATVIPGKLLLRCFDAKDHGRAFSVFLQNLPTDVSGGEAGVNNHDFDLLVTELEKRIAAVAQKLLNDKTPTLWDYNKATKGELEPYFILTVDNCADLDKDRLNRVLKIMQNGPQAGVSTILAASNVDSIRKCPGGEEVLKSSLLLNVSNSGVQLEQGGFRLSREIELDLFPDGAQAANIFSAINKVHKQLADETVPFVLDPTGQWSTGDCLAGIAVTIGRTKAGEGMRLLFNEDAFTGALVVGSSGQGKSNLLHVIIARLMLTYSAKHLNLCLLDLKGTEFNIYARSRSPHVKMILSDMSQKLGLAILREFEGELQRRKRLLSGLQKQKLSEYNKSPGVETLPRLVIIIDEFQKLFTNDVGLSREAEAIVTNLLRQGRSYGVHLIMASQNLSPQTTPRDIKTMFPIKIVLKFNSLSDYATVLEGSDDLDALLTKPGQAMHYAGTGTPTPFTIPYLPFSELEPILQQVATVLASKGEMPSEMVFLNGEEDSDIRKNGTLLNTITRGGTEGPIPLWLGDAFSLSGSASVTLRRQKAANLLIACQDRHLQSAINVVCVSILAVLAHNPNSRCFVIQSKTPGAESLLPLMTAAFPARIQVVAEDDVNAIHKLAESIKSAARSQPTETVLVIFPGIQKFNTLGGDFQNIYNRPVIRTPVPAPTLAESLQVILEQGPTMGFHSIVLTDSPSRLERSTLGNFNLRIGFRLTDTDSLSLFQTKDAEALPDGLAVLLDRGEASLGQEFRPYLNIPPDWLEKQISTIKARQVAQI